MPSSLRHAFRRIWKSPGFAITAIVTLALGIGSSTAIFAVLDAVLLEPLPFAQPDRLVAVAAQPDGVVSIPTMQDYQSRSTAFMSLGAYRGWSPAQKTTDATAARRILVVSQAFFATLGTRFALGAGWPMTGNEQDCSSQAVVSGGYWKRLGGGEELGNKVVNLDGRDFQISVSCRWNRQLRVLTTSTSRKCLCRSVATVKRMLSRGETIASNQSGDSVRE